LVVLDSDQQSFLTGRVRAVQIIIAAMAIGVLVFLAVAFFVHTKVGAIDKTHKLDIITQIALVYGVVALIGGPILAGALVKFGRRRLACGGGPVRPAPRTASGFEGKSDQDGTSRLIGLMVTRTIISGAIYEGASLFLGVAYLLNRGLLTAVCAVLLVVALLMQMPTRDRARRWIDEQLRQIEQEKQAAQ
jgi:hypothetical protein